MCFTLPIPITHYPLHIIRIITFGKTHLKKWSEPLRKKKEKFYDLKEETSKPQYIFFKEF